jgi:hypothetical protein
MPGSFFSASISRAIGSANLDMICVQEIRAQLMTGLKIVTFNSKIIKP